MLEAEIIGLIKTLKNPDTNDLEFRNKLAELAPLIDNTNYIELLFDQEMIQ